MSKIGYESSVADVTGLPGEEVVVGWRPCPGAPGYWVSSLGQVLQGPPPYGRPMSVGHGKDGRETARVFVTPPGEGQKCLSLARAVLEAFEGPPPEEGMVVRYRDGDP